MLLKTLFKKIFILEYNLITFLNINFWSRVFIFNIIFLVVLSVLSIWGANFLERIVDPLKYTNDTNVIIEIYPEVNHERTKSKKDIVEDYLTHNSNVISFKVLSSNDLKNLLNDWNNILNNLSEFSFPILVNVVLDSRTSYSANDLQLALSQKVNNVFVYSEKQLASKLTSSINISRKLILLIPLILFFIIFAIVLFTTVGLVYSQRESISVLSFLGAPYGAVAKEFAYWAFQRTVKGSIIGLVIALIIVESLAIFFNIGWFIIPSSTTVCLMLAVIVAIPLEATIITFFWVRRVISWVI